MVAQGVDIIKLCAGGDLAVLQRVRLVMKGGVVVHRGPLGAAQDPAAPASSETVTDLEQRFTSALLARDAAAFDRLLADDLVHIGFEGQIAGKETYMEFFKRGAWRYVKYQPSNVTVKPLGTAAVVTGRVDRTILVNDKEITGAFAFTHVWVRAEDGWRLTSSQVTNVQ